MTTDLSLIPAQFLPDDLAEFSAHPDNDRHLVEIQIVRDKLSEQANRMRPRDVPLIRDYQSGMNFTATAEKRGTTPQAVSQAVHSLHGKRFKALLDLLDATMGIATAGQRHAMAWRIAVAHEAKDPRVSLSAIAELNKLEHQDRVIDANMTGGGTINIQINNELLPRGPLDA